MLVGLYLSDRHTSYSAIISLTVINTVYFYWWATLSFRYAWYSSFRYAWYSPVDCACDKLRRNSAGGIVALLFFTLTGTCAAMLDGMRQTASTTLG